MSDSENTENTNNSEDTANTAAQAMGGAGNALSKVMELKDSNPKVFFGAIGAVVVLLLIVMMSGGSSNKKLTQATFTKLTVGQQYTLKGANSASENATISIATVAGTVSAFDEDEVDPSAPNACKQIPEGTSVKVIDLQKSLGVTYANVEILEGECQGKKGWALSIDIK
ncbi:MAG: hypothetical protein GQ569_13320 [Methylococcaceae bacterium]|nr:hypothetical protein [Methylococcaceae bacterium]